MNCENEKYWWKNSEVLRPDFLIIGFSKIKIITNLKQLSGIGCHCWVKLVLSLNELNIWHPEECRHNNVK
jgi:hypothetical protein